MSVINVLLVNVMLIFSAGSALPLAKETSVPTNQAYTSCGTIPRLWLKTTIMTRQTTQSWLTLTC